MTCLGRYGHANAAHWYRCDVCVREGFWHQGDWRWYGTVDEVLAHVCSDDCQRRHEAGERQRDFEGVIS